MTETLRNLRVSEMPPQHAADPKTPAQQRARFFNSGNAFNVQLPPVPDMAFAEEPARALDPATLSDPELSSDEAALAASKVARMNAVRDVLLQFQRDFAESPFGGASGAVLDGRDIGTVVCPEAPVKLFVVASAEVRAERRHKELLERGEAIIYSRVLQDMKDRDERDTNRSVAPLKPADNAVILDTSGLNADEAFAAALAEVEKSGR